MLICAAHAANSILSLIVPLLFLGILYFIMMRPQKKQQQQYRDMISSLNRGAHVVTIGGLYGVIDSIDRDNGTVILDCDGIYLTFKLQAIREVITPAKNTKSNKKVKKTDDSKEISKKKKSSSIKEKKDNGQESISTNAEESISNKKDNNLESENDELSNISSIDSSVKSNSINDSDEDNSSSIVDTIDTSKKN